MSQRLQLPILIQNSVEPKTASGGEPLSQLNFLIELFKLCQQRGIHTTLDTCGYAEPGALAKVLAYTDPALYGLKHMDSAVHKKFTGVPNELIRENARLVVSRESSIIFRIPLIPGHNDSDDNIRACAEFAIQLGISEVDLLPYHRYGSSKYQMLGRKYKLAKMSSVVPEQVERPRQVIEGYGLACTVEG